MNSWMKNMGETPGKVISWNFQVVILWISPRVPGCWQLGFFCWDPRRNNVPILVVNTGCGSVGVHTCIIYTPQNKHGSQQLMVCRCFSFSKGGISRFHVCFRVYTYIHIIYPVGNDHISPPKGTWEWIIFLRLSGLVGYVNLSLEDMYSKSLQILGGGFNFFFKCSPLPGGKWSNLTCAYFSDGLRPPTRIALLIIWVFPKIRDTPKWMVFNGKPYFLIDDFGGKTHYFRKHPYIHTYA